MAEIRPFRGLRFNRLLVPDLSLVVCPPYDVISPELQAALHQRHPLNIVRLEFGYDHDGEDRYQRAAATLARWTDDGVLIRDNEPAFYLHQVTFKFRHRTYTRRELIAAVRLEDWEAGVVLPHERTMLGPRLDRLNLLRATRTNLSPVFGLYRRTPPTVDAMWSDVLALAPDVEFTDDERAHHALWVITDPERGRDVRAEFSPLAIYIADGHHRYETALRYREERRAQTGSAHGPWDYVMMHLVAADDPGLLVLPTHRMLRGIPGLDQQQLESVLAPHFQLRRHTVRSYSAEEAARLLGELAAAREPHAFGVLGPDPSVFLVATAQETVRESLPRERSEAWRRLDVAVLDTLIVGPLLSEAALPREEVLVYTREEAEAFALVGDRHCQIALFVRPTPVEAVLAVADARDRMPEKSTYFYPKPPTGLVLKRVE